MQALQGLTGILLILGIAFLLSNNKKKINYRLVISGLLLQLGIAILILKVPPVTRFFQMLGHGMEKIEQAARQGAAFVYGNIMVDNYTGGSANYRDNGFVFAFSVAATIILVCVLVAILYHFGIMQRIVSVIAKAMNTVMRVSGAEALSNVASAFVGQVEAQVMIRPYLAGMTRSELLASMSGSLACIAGGILIVYVNMGAKAEYLLAASLMAAPAALVISKIIYPETEESQTMGEVKLEVKSPYTNIIDAISHGAGDGMKISVNVIAMLIGFIGLIAFINFILGYGGTSWNHLMDYFNIKSFHFVRALSLDEIFAKVFTPFAWAMGVPQEDVAQVATLLGKKLTVNEFIAFNDLTTELVQKDPITKAPILNAAGQKMSMLSDKANMIVSFAICGFANFSSVGMQIGGIGELAPERRKDLAELGMKALVCGTLASYLSATIAGLLFHV
jgi:concentrative nucleoside transporter, CNT family